VVQGIVVDRTPERIVLKDATGVQQTIAAADIEQEVEGKSLMPKGLVRFMTHQELLDLVKFLSQLGRAGDFAIRSTLRMQRYRVLASPEASSSAEIPNDEQFEATLYRSPLWLPIYAHVDGTLPLDDASKAAGGPSVYLYGEFEVTEPGLLGVKVDDAEGIHAWLDEDSLDLKPDAKIEGQPGRHRITLRVDTATRKAPAIRLEFFRLPDSKAEFRPVDGA
jgi:hypothetical protein